MRGQALTVRLAIATLFLFLALGSRSFAGAAPFEPNDSILEPSGPLSAGQTYEAAIETPSDTDFFVFYVTAAHPTHVAIILRNRSSRGGAASNLNASILDSEGTVIDPFAYAVGPGGEASAANDLGPGKYLIEIAPVEGSVGEIPYSLATAGAEASFGPYASIASRCAGATAAFDRSRQRLQAANAKLQRALARLRGARFAGSETRESARDAYRKARRVEKAGRRSATAAGDAREPWCSIAR